MKKHLFSTSIILIFSLCMQAQSYVPEKQQPLMKVKPVVPVKAYSFHLQDVQLLDGPFKTAMEADVRYLLLIKPDRLLADFREHAGLKAKGERYGGWENSGLAGHTLGHYLSACAMHYAVTRSKLFLDKVNYIVDELAKCQPKRNGYVGAIPKEDSMWAEVEKGNIRSRGFDLNGAWSPWYTVHKIMAGLLDAYLYCDNKKALTVETGIADWSGHIIRNLPDSSLQRMLFCEYGGMNDVLVNSYALTGNKKYLDLSYKFHDKRILDSLALQKDILPGKHSNTQIPKVIGCIRRYELTASEKDKTIAGFFWKTVVENHSYAPGGNSNYEYLGPPGKLNDALTDNTMETCNTYNMLKLTRHLFALQPSVHFMDYYEKALYNHILSSQNHSNGMMCYFVPLRMGTQKEFSDSFNTFTCCVGSGMENHVKYGESIYFLGADGSLYVNLFIASRLNWKEKGVVVEQQTQLPVDNKILFTIKAVKPAAFPLRIRNPYWSKQRIVVAVNGKEVPDVQADANGYFTISRTWKTGDKIEFKPDLQLYTEAMPDNPNRVAVFYGPLVLAGVFGNKEPDPVTGIPVLVSTETNPAQWLKADNSQPLVFHSVNTGQPKEVTLMPFNQVQKEFYSVYWDLFTPQSWGEQQKVYEAERKKRHEMEIKTVDLLRLGEMQPERDHDFVGDRVNIGEEHTKKYRIAYPGGFFTFNMKVDPSTINSLLCTYWGMDNRGRIFDILINDVKVATEDLNKYKASKFYEIVYAIPAELTKGKDKVKVTFKPAANNMAGPVYGEVRMMKGE
ncbi:glycoside hydrolase family 127 protein [Niastella caeni]|uniref:Glycoside hydrolase family 127 protein n=1 Tax=Niastella caeni TaxID=2569763 RepID=A0A4S8HGW3_9BACT|nr:glycoside hydrolase family 127 protein [Niastella caeni]THU34175.1 glycoside hydrolase family 127 protein [Niastella caeni]